MICVRARDDQDLPVADGQLVAQGYTVAQIAPTGTLVAEVDLVGPDVARAREQLRVRVRHHGWKDEEFEGRVQPACFAEFHLCKR